MAFTKPPSSVLDTTALLEAIKALKSGDYTVRLPATRSSADGEVADAFNDLVEHCRRMSDEKKELSGGAHSHSVSSSTRTEDHALFAREQAARALAEQATIRSKFLAEASTVLAATLYSDRTLRALTRHIVPFLADACAVTFADEAGGPRETELSWRRPQSTSVQSHTAPGCTALPSRLTATVEQILSLKTAEVQVDFGDDDAKTRAPESSWPGEFTPRRALVMPLKAHGRVLGVLCLITSETRAAYNADEISLAKEVAGRAATALENARLYQGIQESDRRKNEFLAMLAHELRNPLAPIRNAVEILRAASLEQPELHWAQDVIDRQVQQLVRLVDDLLDISRITRGKITLQKQTVRLADVVARAVEMSRPLMEDRRQTLDCRIPPEPVHIQGDPIRLTQVMCNLLNNAAKYTGDGGQIWVALEHDGRNGVIHVRDSGVGIPEGMLGRVFELFTQVDASLDRSRGGLGVGLTLVRTIVEMHRGTVAAFSPGANQGSEFVVTLPLARTMERAADTPPRDRKEMNESSRRRILVVDDNADAAKSLAMLLRLRGHDTQVYFDGLSALEHAAAFRPDLILLDIGLPGMDGYEVARCIRRCDILKHTPLAAVTGYGRPEDHRRSQEAGFDHHLVKPIEIRQLDELLARLVESPVA